MTAPGLSGRSHDPVDGRREPRHMDDAVEQVPSRPSRAPPRARWPPGSRDRAKSRPTRWPACRDHSTTTLGRIRTTASASAWSGTSAPSMTAGTPSSAKAAFSASSGRGVIFARCTGENRDRRSRGGRGHLVQTGGDRPRQQVFGVDAVAPAGDRILHAVQSRHAQALPGVADPVDVQSPPDHRDHAVAVEPVGRLDEHGRPDRRPGRRWGPVAPARRGRRPKARCPGR